MVMIHPSKLLKFTGAEINTLQMKLDTHNQNMEILDSIDDYEIWKLVQIKLDKEFNSLNQLMDNIYMKSVKRKQCKK
jgi:hypothetical protein